ncbi:ribosome hibernation factor-recruiting GTPase MRF [Gordonia crocea]|uniref:Putative cobalamin synthesis protein n=1 Tax=Gordonia crocea TaxID=589162 RepID=A0A7M3SUV1_9ACTN|nr:GTP-binding protein [Gordonia crocea]GED96425.1 putative cobalamin synthesis protein [Gordonia crocea]
MKIVPNNGDGRTPLVLVAGLDSDAVERTAAALLIGGTTLVHHDLSELDAGRVRRTLRAVDLDGEERVHQSVLELEHGCVSCTLRNDLLPLLRQLHRRDSVERIVLQLDSALEPEALTWAIEHAVVSDMPGYTDAPAAEDVRIEATVACIHEGEWLDAATGDATMAELGRSATTDESIDERTLAQVAVGHVAFADALVIAGSDPAMRDAWESARLAAVLKRLAPSAPMIMEIPQRRLTTLLMTQLLAAVPAGSRRGRLDAPHDPLLRDQPPLDADCGVELFTFEAERPFHPARLHTAIDHLLEGVVCTRGRVWLATQPDSALWVESAGGGLRVGEGSRWLASLDETTLDGVDPERRAMAALRWTTDHGDRHSSLVVLTHRPERPEEICRALHEACLTDEEMALGQAGWMGFDDPFGLAHNDPCDDLPRTAEVELTHREDNQ